MKTPSPPALPVTLGTITAEGFSSLVSMEVKGGMEYVRFLADADIDADGANGQSGAPAAYIIGDKGTEHLANGGLSLDGKIAKPWARDIFLLGPDNQPQVFPGGRLASTTWYHIPGRALSDPAAYLDSETVPYIVVPPLVITHTLGVVRGCLARITWRGKSIEAVVGDKGPRNRIGELSIAAARALGMPSSPRNGGVEAQEVLYELWPGQPARGFVLQPE